jgi:hypothetical protein
VAHACNPSYLGGWDQQDHSSRTTWANSLQDPTSKITRAKWTAGVACRALICNHVALSSKPDCIARLCLKKKSYKIKEQEGRTSPAPRGGVVPVGGGRCSGKWVGGWVWCDKMCTHVSKCKNDTYWNYSRNLERGGMKENDWGGEFMYDIFDTLQYLCKWHNVPPCITIIKEKHLKKNYLYRICLEKW